MMALMPIRPSRLSEPHGVKLPPVRGSIHINTVASREPPSKSWSRYKRLLIDNPQDANLLQRQKLWNFQKLNRGAFRSQISSLPDIPYRVHTNSVEKTSIGIQVDCAHRFTNSIRVVLPNYSFKGTSRYFVVDTDDETGPTRDKACSPMHQIDSDDYEDDFESDSDIEDPGFEFDSVIRTRNAGTMTEGKKDGAKFVKRKDKKKKRARDRHASTERKSILVQNNERAGNSQSVDKNVKFEQDVDIDTSEVSPEQLEDETQTSDTSGTPEVPAVIEKVDIAEKVKADARVPPIRVPTSDSFYSNGSYAKVDVGENIGHSSHLTLDPLSVIDFLSGSRTERYRQSETNTPQGRHSLDISRDKRKGRGKHVKDPEADRVWFQQLVGDKDIVDLGSYDNFARTRPNIQDSPSDSNNDRYTDMNKVGSRKGFTPRINSEASNKTSSMKFAPYLAKSNSQSPALAKSRIQKRGLPNLGKPYY